MALKLFTQTLYEGWVRLTTSDRRESLQISFDRSKVPHVGLWLNYRGWSGAGTPPSFNCGIEPTTSPADDLAAAILEETAAYVPAGATCGWQLSVTLHDNRTSCEFSG